MKRKRNEGGAADGDSETLLQKDSSPSFSDFDLDPRLLQALAQEGFSTPTLVQAKAIPLALEGRDVLGRLSPLFSLHFILELTPLTDRTQRAPRLVLEKPLPIFCPSFTLFCGGKLFVAPFKNSSQSSSQYTNR